MSAAAEEKEKAIKRSNDSETAEKKEDSEHKSKEDSEHKSKEEPNGKEEPKGEESKRKMPEAKDKERYAKQGVVQRRLLQAVGERDGEISHQEPVDVYEKENPALSQASAMSDRTKVQEFKE